MNERDTPDLEAAYALSGSESNRKLYADWADTYDSAFAADMEYLLPLHVARAFAKAGGQGPVLDLGAGTGLVGEVLAQLGIGPVDGSDLSEEMLEKARAKGVYQNLFAGDMTARLPVSDGAYDGVVCAGTFTHGHVGPEAMPEILRCLAPGGLAALSINEAFYHKAGFEAALNRLLSSVELQAEAVPIYGDKATGQHRSDRALIVVLRKTGKV